MMKHFAYLVKIVPFWVRIPRFRRHDTTPYLRHSELWKQKELDDRGVRKPLHLFKAPVPLAPVRVVQSVGISKICCPAFLRLELAIELALCFFLITSEGLISLFRDVFG